MSTFDDTLSFDVSAQFATHETCPFDSEFNRAQVHSFLQEVLCSTAQDGSPEPDLSMVSKLTNLQDFQADSSMASGEVGRVLEQASPGQWVEQPSVRQHSPLEESWWRTLNIEMHDSPTSPKHRPNTACFPDGSGAFEDRDQAMDEVSACGHSNINISGWQIATRPTAETQAPVAAGQDTAAGHKRKNDSQSIGLQTGKKMTTAVGLFSPRQDKVNWHLVSRCFEQLFLLYAQQTNNFQIPTKEVHGFLMDITRQRKDGEEIKWKWEGLPQHLKSLEFKFKTKGLTVDSDISERGSGKQVLRLKNGQIYIHQGETFAILCELYTAGACTEDKLWQKIIGKYDNLTREVVKLFFRSISFHNYLLGIPSSAGGVRWDLFDTKKISFPSLGKLNLSGVGLDTGAAEKLAEGLSQLTLGNLKDFSVRDNSICVNGLLMLEDAIISSSKMLVTVDFAGNLINEEEAGLVSTQFTLQCPHMQHTIVKADGVNNLQCCVKVNGRAYLCESTVNTRPIGDVSQEQSNVVGVAQSRPTFEISDTRAASELELGSQPVGRLSVRIDGTLQRCPEGFLKVTIPESDILLSESAELEMLQRMLPGFKVVSFNTLEVEEIMVHSKIIESKQFLVPLEYSDSVAQVIREAKEVTPAIVDDPLIAPKANQVAIRPIFVQNPPVGMTGCYLQFLYLLSREYDREVGLPWEMEFFSMVMHKVKNDSSCKAIVF
jgi:hypothetical protein